MREKMIRKAENFTKRYVWNSKFSRQSVIDTLVIQGETIQALRERWQDSGDYEDDVDIDSDENYRKVVDTINAHYMEILTDLLNSASPVTEEPKSMSK
ncbi:MAG: hypothetical protein GY761_20400 [Hyphomicrobiales bacterium]|nr:hypothetical protein [Hyphomicrobiales bacterium]